MSSGPSSAFVQLRALVGLRLRMVRSRRGRLGFVVLAALVPASLLGASAAFSLPDEQRFTLSLLAPTVFLGFAVLSVVSPLTSGGGSELYPPEQLVAFPVTPTTHFLAGLLVLPLNLAWLLQLLCIVASVFLLVPLAPSAAPAALELALFVLAVSATGQAVTWLVLGARRTRHGRVLVTGCTAAVVLAGALAVRLVGAAALLDRSPTSDLALSVLDAADRGLLAVLPTVMLLLAASVVALLLGHRACAWALRRPGDAGVFRESRNVGRRPDQQASLAAQDRASLWRSPSLRRGILVLGLLPGTIAALLGADWSTLVILPGLVAAGAGLLFGVNAFCLDGTGAVWLASLPHDPRTAIRAKTRVLAEACLGAVLLAVLAGLLRVERGPTPAELNAVLCACLASVTCVVGTCLRWSTTRPHKAELRGARDTPAPPGSMAVYSLRLAVGMTFLGLALSVGARTPVWWLPWLLGAPALLLAARRTWAAWRRWDDPFLRARVVTTVAHG